MTRSWARRSFAAETIFMALVICCVFLTERIRRRMSTRAGMEELAGLLHGLGLEDARQLLQRGLDLVRQLALDVLLLRHLLEDLGVPRVHEPVQLLLVAAGGGGGGLVGGPVVGGEERKPRLLRGRGG